jgi:tRNA(Ser,Leu) C12 N-acetylase TAN1
MNIKTLEILAGLATKLDEKGATKVADHVEHMMNKYSQDFGGPLSAPEKDPADWKGSVDTTELDMSDPAAEARIGATPGNIKPAGDPYTYNLNADKTFSVATTPRGSENIIDRVIRPGDGGYGKLQAEAIRMGLMEAAPAAPKMVTSPGSMELYQALSEIGWGQERASNESGKPVGQMPTLDVISGQADRTRAEYNSKLKEAFQAWDQGAGHTSKGMLERAAASMLAPGAGSQSIQKAYEENVKPMLSQSSTGAEAQALFEEAFALIEEWKKVLRVKRMMSPSQNMADDDEIREEVEKTSSEVANEKIEKIASLKEDYRKVFWFEPTRAFNRSNTKFKR